MKKLCPLKKPTLVTSVQLNCDRNECSVQPQTEEGHQRVTRPSVWKWKQRERHTHLDAATWVR